MKFLRYLTVAIVSLVLVFGGLTLAVVAATSPLHIPDAEAMLSVDRDRVELKKADSDEWVVITEDVEVGVGDSVWTNTTGAATITFFDQGVLRLDADTTIVIEQADIDPEHPDVFHGKIYMESGQLWSRMFDFLSEDSTYEVQTASAVATVRGTIFSVWQRGQMSGVYVDQHTVRVSNNGEQKDVTEGDFMMMDPKATKLMDMTKDMDQDMQMWVKRNRELDADFDADMAEKMKAYVKPAGKLVKTAEAIRLKLSGHSEALADRFAARNSMHARMQQLMSVEHNAPLDPTPSGDHAQVSLDAAGCRALDTDELMDWQCSTLNDTYQAIYPPKWSTSSRGDSSVFTAPDEAQIFVHYTPIRFLDDDSQAHLRQGGPDAMITNRYANVCQETNSCGVLVESLHGNFAGQAVTVYHYRFESYTNKQRHIQHEYIAGITDSDQYYEIRLTQPDTLTDHAQAQHLEEYVTVMQTLNIE